MVVAESAGGEPTGRNYRIKRLEYILAYLGYMNELLPYGVDPYEYNTEEYGKEDPAGPHIGVHTVEQVSYHDSRDRHRL